MLLLGPANTSDLKFRCKKQHFNVYVSMEMHSVWSSLGRLWHHGSPDVWTKKSQQSFGAYEADKGYQKIFGDDDLPLPFATTFQAHTTYHICPSPGHLAIWPSAIACHGQKLPEPGTRPPFVEAKFEARFAWTEPANSHDSTRNTPPLRSPYEVTENGFFQAWNHGFWGCPEKKPPELTSFLDDDQQICLNQILGRFSLNERFSRLRSPGRCRSPARLPDSQSIWPLQQVPPIFLCRQNYPRGAVIKTLGADIPWVILVL